MLMRLSLRVLGAILVLLGLLNLGWVAYNLFVDELPQFKNSKFALQIGLGALFLYMGLRWLFGRPEDRNRNKSTT
jgi:hypothetical protein